MKYWTHGIAFQACSRGRLAPQSCGEKAETLGLTGLSGNTVHLTGEENIANEKIRQMKLRIQKTK